MEKTKFSIKTYLEYINENKDEKLFNQLLTESYDMTKDQEILVDMEIDRIVETFKDKDLNLLTNEDIDKIIKDILTAKRIFPYNKSEYGKEIAKYNNLINQRLGVTQRDMALAECTVPHWQDVKNYALELLKGI